MIVHRKIIIAVINGITIGSGKAQYVDHTWPGPQSFSNRVRRRCPVILKVYRGARAIFGVIFSDSSGLATSDQHRTHVSLLSPDCWELIARNQGGKTETAIIDLHEKIVCVAISRFPISDKGEGLIPIILNQTRSELRCRVKLLSRRPARASPAKADMDVDGIIVEVSNY